MEQLSRCVPALGQEGGGVQGLNPECFSSFDLLPLPRHLSRNLSISRRAPNYGRSCDCLSKQSRILACELLNPDSGVVGQNMLYCCLETKRWQQAMFTMNRLVMLEAESLDLEVQSCDR